LASHQLQACDAAMHRVLAAPRHLMHMARSGFLLSSSRWGRQQRTSNPTMRWVNMSCCLHVFQIRKYKAGHCPGINTISHRQSWKNTDASRSEISYQTTQQLHGRNTRPARLNQARQSAHQAGLHGPVRMCTCMCARPADTCTQITLRLRGALPSCRGGW